MSEITEQSLRDFAKRTLADENFKELLRRYDAKIYKKWRVALDKEGREKLHDKIISMEELLKELMDYSTAEEREKAQKDREEKGFGIA